MQREMYGKINRREAFPAMQATVLVGLVSYVIWRDRRLKGTPLQTWPGWYAPSPFFDTRGLCDSEQS